MACLKPCGVNAGKHGAGTGYARKPPHCELRQKDTTITRLDSTVESLHGILKDKDGLWEVTARQHHSKKKDRKNTYSGKKRSAFNTTMVSNKDAGQPYSQPCQISYRK